MTEHGQAVLAGWAAIATALALWQTGRARHDAARAADAHKLREDRDVACSLLDGATRERNEARAELRRTIMQLSDAQRALDAERQARGTQVAQLQRELASRAADCQGAEAAHADCERRLADMGDRLAAEQQAAGQANERERRLEREVESLKASLAAAKAAQDAPQAAAAPEAQAAPAVVTKGRRRRA